MEGIIKRVFWGKDYGFIAGDNGIDYFFRRSSLLGTKDLTPDDIDERVEFNEKSTFKGLVAINIFFTQEKRYELPHDVVFSAGKHVKGWETIESTQWSVEGSSDVSPNKAKEMMLARVKHCGGNAVVSADCSETTGWNGKYKFTIYNYRGQVVRIARRTKGKGVQKHEMNSLESEVEAFKKMCDIETAKNLARYKKIRGGVCIALLIVAEILYLVGRASENTIVSAGSLLSVIACFLFFIYYRKPVSYGAWLRKI